MEGGNPEVSSRCQLSQTRQHSPLAVSRVTHTVAQAIICGHVSENSKMPSVQLTIPHQLGQEEALARLKGFLGKVKQRYQTQVSDLHETWTDNVVQFGFKTYGFTVSGQMTVEPADVRFDAKVPMAAMMFKGKIEQTLRDEISRVLA
jgi:hypothetical protein